MTAIAPAFLPYGAHPDDTPGDVSAAACRHLWVSFMAAMWDSSFSVAGMNGNSRAVFERQDACRWFETRDCALVCRLLDLDVVAVRERWCKAQAQFERTGEAPLAARFFAR